MILFDITGKFEINLHQSRGADIVGVGNFLVKNRISAVVLPHELFESMVIDKQVKMAQYKIIISIDFEQNGKNYALDKFRDLPPYALEADGYDIMLTPGVNDIQTNNEMKAIIQFIRRLNPLAEFRWVMNTRRMERSEIRKMLEKAKVHPVDAIRTDPNVSNTVDISEHVKDVNYIRKYLSRPIKVSGGVTYEVFDKLKSKVSKFDVTVQQAQAILHAATEARKPRPEPVAADDKDLETDESDGGSAGDSKTE